ncbi:hypothetical protein ACOI1H_13135 [Loktanella sp. DJP18]|uniref:hypothetical protein n=1 Tax=Loktanella sp. DJP18 TaxID=3409788 RepID=UPI003BB7C208
MTNTDRRVDPIVGLATTLLVPDGTRTFALKILQRPVDVSSAQSQHVGSGHSRHDTTCRLAQRINAVQFAFAHDDQSHGHTPILFDRHRRVTLLADLNHSDFGRAGSVYQTPFSAIIEDAKKGTEAERMDTQFL